MDIDDKDDDN